VVLVWRFGSESEAILAMATAIFTEADNWAGSIEVTEASPNA
jgi:hypothetical protein